MSARELALLEAVRIRPSAAAMKQLRASLDAMDAMSGDRSEKLQAGALRILLENYDRGAGGVVRARGNAMSQRNSGRDRVANDLYETPAWVVHALAEHIHLDGRRVWEPAAGSGKMVRALQSCGAAVVATDIKDYGIGPAFRGVFDFTSTEKCPWIDDFDLLISNPPYGDRGRLATEFLEVGMLRIAQRGAMAMLLPIDFDSAKGRSHLFRDSPFFVAKIVLQRRIVWFEPEPDEDRSGPSSNHAWFVHAAPLFIQRAAPRTLYSPTLDLERAA